ncbi:hypothetical protein NXT3_PB00422 (plasmid) [Sinorhizobium fredii]|uniref:Uncharacterized protein n=1 Tax=Rhizobium fredii TaxID=380 RepID=A0A2L0HC83_RHIFR|nr:hypothetical protein NXT3_PB00422 [Sinorhizobium fredii]
MSDIVAHGTGNRAPANTLQQSIVVGLPLTGLRLGSLSAALPSHRWLLQIVPDVVRCIFSRGSCYRLTSKPPAQDHERISARSAESAACAPAFADPL